MPTTETQLLTPAFMKQLDRLDIRSRKILLGKLQGERRSKKRGQSVEFADFRNYVVGDDLRRIDWNLFARLDKLFLRLFLEEEDLTLTLVIDSSASMNYGEPNKLLYAKQIAAALGYIGLNQHNRVSFISLAGDIQDRLPNLRGKRPVPQMLSFLEDLAPVEGPCDLTQAFKQINLTLPNPGVIVVISDWVDKGDLSQAIKYLAAPRFDTYALQILSPQEIDPTQAMLAGDLSLEDIEDGNRKDVSISAALIKKYKQNLDAYIQHVQTTCAKRGLMHLFASTDRPFDDVVLRYMREKQIIT